MQVTLTQVSRKQKTSTKTGKPFESLGIKCQEYGDKWLSGFGRADNKDWKAGDKVEITVIEKGEYLNFEMPERPKALGFSMEDRDRLLRIEIAVQKLLSMAANPKDDYPDNTFPDSPF